MQVLREVEAKIEGRYLRWLKSVKIDHRKMNGLGNRSWPDQMICLPVSPFFIEFKRVGEGLSELQKLKINELLALGYLVEIHDDSEEAIKSTEEKNRKDPPRHGRYRKWDHPTVDRRLHRTP